MPANLSPDYYDAEARYRAASTTEDRLSALEEMLRVIPKHKGTAKMQADLKGRIAKLRREPKKKAGTGRAAAHVVPKQGAGQVVLAGPPNTGKSALLKTLTHANPEVADFPFTTREEQPGMMAYEDIAIQLVDLPPLSPDFVEPWVYDIVRRADLVWLVVDAAGSFDELQLANEMLKSKRILVYPAASEPPLADERAMLRKPALLVVTHADHPDFADYLEILRELLVQPWAILPVSAVTGAGTDTLAATTFSILGVMRIYTKQPGKAADRVKPFTLPVGSTVGDLARTIHKDMEEKLKFARIWGPSAFDGQTVHHDHVLADRDVVELHL